MKKRALTVLLAACLGLTLTVAGCGGSGSKQANAQQTDASAEETAEDDKAEPDAAEAEAEAEAEAAETEAAAATEEKAPEADAEASDLEDVTELLGTEELAKYKDQKVRFTGLHSVDIEDVGGDLIRFLYNAEGTGDTGDDLYFCMVREGEVMEEGHGHLFIVKADLCGPETETYQTIEELGEEAVVDMEGIISEVDGKIVPAITKITVLDPGIIYE